MLMQRAGIAGRSGARKRYGIPSVATADDLVDRMFVRGRPDQLWLTDVTEHPTREGNVYCAVVLDAFSRPVVGWSISHNPTAALTCNALGMAIEQRGAAPVRRTVWAPETRPALRARRRLAPSESRVGDARSCPHRLFLGGTGYVVASIPFDDIGEPGSLFSHAGISTASVLTPRCHRLAAARERTTPLARASACREKGGMRILITGGSGVLGCAKTSLLERPGHEVVAPTVPLLLRKGAAIWSLTL
jgi:hypothetical protein